MFYRLGIQSFLEYKLKWKPITVIIATSIIWAVAHENIINPDYLKFIQVFPFGIALGILFRKKGIMQPILAHGFINVIAVYISPYLI